MATPGGIKAGEAFVELTTKDAKLRAGLAKAQAKMKAFADGMRSMGSTLIMAAGAIGLPMAGALKVFADFDDQMRTVQAVTAATGQDFKDMTELAKKLGRETSYTASQVASSMVSLGRMGLTAKEIQKSTGDVMNFARATNTELGSAADYTANMLRIFKKDASETGNVVDILTATANNSAQTMENLAEALKYAGSQAGASNESLEDICAALGILANLGIKGELAGTAIRKMFIQFSDPGVVEYLEKFNITTKDVYGNLLPFVDIVKQTGKVMKNMPSFDKIRFAQSVFNVRGATGGLSLGNNIKQLENFINILSDCKGVAAQTAADMDKGLGGAFRLLESAIEGDAIAFGEVLTPTIMEFAQSVTGAALILRDFIVDHQSLVITVAKVTAGIAVLGGALVALGVTIKVSSIVIGGLSYALLAFSGVKIVVIACLNSMSLAFTAFGVAVLDGATKLKALGVAFNYFFASTPAGWAILAIAAIAGVAYAIYKLTTQVRDYGAEVDKIIEKNEQMSTRANTDRSDVDRLAELEKLGRLTNAQMTEAEHIINRLTAAYGDMGYQIDKTNRKLVALSKTQAEISKEKIRKKESENTEKDIYETLTSISSAKKERKKWEKYLELNKNNPYAETISEESIKNKIAELDKKIPELQKKADGLAEKLEMLNAESKDYQETVTNSLVINPRLAEIESKWADDKKSPLDKKFEELKKIEEEYIEISKAAIEAAKAAGDFPTEQKLLSQKMYMETEFAARYEELQREQMGINLDNVMRKIENAVGSFNSGSFSGVAAVSARKDKVEDYLRELVHIQKSMRRDINDIDRGVLC